MVESGRLVAIEGGEGVGKSTQAALLARALPAELTREPGGSPIGERIRALLLDPTVSELAPRTELMLMLAARSQHVAERIEPALASGRDVVVDRFAGSTLAYQGFGRGIALDEVRAACEVASGGRWPDLSVLLDMAYEGARRRRSGRVQSSPGQARPPDRIEAEEDAFHRRVNDGFRSIAAADPAHWVVVDASGSADQVAALVAGAVAERLGWSDPAGGLR